MKCVTKPEKKARLPYNTYKFRKRMIFDCAKAVAHTSALNCHIYETELKAIMLATTVT